MVFNDMSLHIALLGGTVRAVGTGKGLLTRVGADMGADALHLRRLEETVWTGKLILGGVDAQVLGEFDGSGSAETTVGTVVDPSGGHDDNAPGD